MVYNGDTMTRVGEGDERKDRLREYILKTSLTQLLQLQQCLLQLFFKIKQD